MVPASAGAFSVDSPPSAVGTGTGAPPGVRFGVQIHTGDSLTAAEHTHRIYEEWRSSTTPLERKAELEALQGEIFTSVPMPDGTPLPGKDQWPARELRAAQAEMGHGVCR